MYKLNAVQGEHSSRSGANPLIFYIDIIFYVCARASYGKRITMTPFRDRERET